MFRYILHELPFVARSFVALLVRFRITGTSSAATRLAPKETAELAAVARPRAARAVRTRRAAGYQPYSFPAVRLPFPPFAGAMASTPSPATSCTLGLTSSSGGKEEPQTTRTAAPAVVRKTLRQPVLEGTSSSQSAGGQAGESSSDLHDETPPKAATRPSATPSSHGTPAAGSLHLDVGSSDATVSYDDQSEAEHRARARSAPQRRGNFDKELLKPRPSAAPTAAAAVSREQAVGVGSSVGRPSLSTHTSSPSHTQLGHVVRGDAPAHTWPGNTEERGRSGRGGVTPAAPDSRKGGHGDGIPVPWPRTGDRPHGLNQQPSHRGGAECGDSREVAPRAGTALPVAGTRLPGGHPLVNGGALPNGGGGDVPAAAMGVTPARGAATMGLVAGGDVPASTNPGAAPNPSSNSSIPSNKSPGVRVAVGVPLPPPGKTTTTTLGGKKGEMLPAEPAESIEDESHMAMRKDKMPPARVMGGTHPYVCSKTHKTLPAEPAGPGCTTSPPRS